MLRIVLDRYRYRDCRHGFRRNDAATGSLTGIHRSVPRPQKSWCDRLITVVDAATDGGARS
jgi:hypothetical protein